MTKYFIAFVVITGGSCGLGAVESGSPPAPFDVAGVRVWKLAAAPDLTPNGRSVANARPAAFAAIKGATVGGRLLMGQFLPRRVDVSELTVVKPKSGIGYVLIGSLAHRVICSGLNERGICIAAVPAAEMGSPSGNSVAATKLLLQALGTAETLADARSILESGDLQAPIAFVVGDGKSPDAAVVERAGKRTAIFGPGDTSEKGTGFFPISNVVRRTGTLLVNQASSAADAATYVQLSEWLTKTQPIDSRSFLTASDAVAAGATSRDRVLFDPIANLIWIGHSQDVGGQSKQLLARFDLLQLLSDASPKGLAMDVADASTNLELANERNAKSMVHVGALRSQDPPSDYPEIFKLDLQSFVAEREPWQVVQGVQRFKVRFPSPMVTVHPENNTVHAEFFLPFGKGPFRTAIVLHIAGGDFELSRFMCQMFATNKVACLFVKLPYYGERRPKTGRIRMLSNDIDLGTAAMRQVVLDLRRACDWIQANPVCDRDKIAVVGVSLGAITGSLAAAIEPRISHACLIMGGAHYENILFESIEKEARESKKAWLAAGKSKAEFAAAMKPIDPATYGQRLRERVILMISADQDKTIPMASTLALWEATGRQPIHWYPCGHYTMAKYLVPALSQTVKFLRQWPERPTVPASSHSGP